MGNVSQHPVTMTEPQWSLRWINLVCYLSWHEKLTIGPRPQDCTEDHLQQWNFVGSIIKAVGTNKCIDVTDGNTNNGAKLQVWTCVDGAANQQFNHWDDPVPFLIVPEDHISWRPHQFKCFDNTDGKIKNGNHVSIIAVTEGTFLRSNRFRYGIVIIPTLTRFVKWICAPHFNCPNWNPQKWFLKPIVNA